VVESSALLKRRSPKGYRGFESLPHRASSEVREDNKPGTSRIARISAIPIGSGCEPLNLFVVYDWFNHSLTIRP
jgi:hypothetical protein